MKKIDENIYLLKGTRSSNIYYLDYIKKAIIDTGHPEEIEKNISLFKESGFDLTKINYIFTTHSHGDHVGGHSYLKRKNPDIQIIGSNNVSTYQSRRDKLQVLVGAEDDFDKFKIDIVVEENDIIDLGNVKLKVIETPGHTIDSVSFLLTEKHILFSGDIIYTRVITQVDYYQDLVKSLHELKQTYEKLEKLNCNIYYTGHGDPIDNAKKNLIFCQKKIKRFEKEPEMILINNLIPSCEFYIHKNPGKTIEEIKDYFFKNMLKFKDQKSLESIDETRFYLIIDKTISLMLLLRLIKLEDNKLFLANEINNYIGIKKV